MASQSELRAAIKRAKELFKKDPQVVEVEAKQVTTIYVTNYVKEFDFEALENVYDIESQLYEEFPDVSFDFRVTRHYPVSK